MNSWKTKLLVGIVACVMAASASAALDVVLEDFESYADDTELFAFGTNDGNGGGWKPKGTAALSLSTTEANSGSQSMKYDYNNSPDPWYSMGMKWLAWSSGDGVDFRPYDILSISFKCTDPSGYLQAVLVDGWGGNQATIKYNGDAVLPVGDWVEWQIDLTAIPDGAKWMVGRVDLVMKDRWDGDNDPDNTYWNDGTVYFDDIGLIVPEPMTMALMSLGGLVLLRRR